MVVVVVVVWWWWWWWWCSGGGGVCDHIASTTDIHTPSSSHGSLGSRDLTCPGLYMAGPSNTQDSHLILSTFQLRIPLHRVLLD